MKCGWMKLMGAGVVMGVVALSGSAVQAEDRCLQPSYGYGQSYWDGDGYDRWSSYGSYGGLSGFGGYGYANGYGLDFRGSIGRGYGYTPYSPVYVAPYGRSNCCRVERMYVPGRSTPWGGRAPGQFQYVRSCNQHGRSYLDRW